MWWGRLVSPQFGHSFTALAPSESCERRMLRLEGVVFLLGTAIDLSHRITGPTGVLVKPPRPSGVTGRGTYSFCRRLQHLR